MRWNLENDEAYVGETEQWDKRNEQHYMKTRAHEKPCTCKGCTEHAKYLKQGTLGAARWFMTPVRVCASKSEAQLLEKKIERKIDPSLNLLALLAVAGNVARLPAFETLVFLRRSRLHGPGRKRGTEADLRGSDATKGAATDAAGSHELTDGSKSLLLLLLLVRSLRMLEELAGDAS